MCEGKSRDRKGQGEGGRERGGSSWHCAVSPLIILHTHVVWPKAMKQYLSLSHLFKIMQGLCIYNAPVIKYSNSTILLTDNAANLNYYLVHVAGLVLRLATCSPLSSQPSVLNVVMGLVLLMTHLSWLYSPFVSMIAIHYTW